MQRVHRLFIRDIYEDTDLIVLLVRSGKLEYAAGMDPDLTLYRGKDTEIQRRFDSIRQSSQFHDRQENVIVIGVNEVGNFFGSMLKIFGREIQKARHRGIKTAIVTSGFQTENISVDRVIYEFFIHDLTEALRIVFHYAEDQEMVLLPYGLHVDAHAVGLAVIGK